MILELRRFTAEEASAMIEDPTDVLWILTSFTPRAPRRHPFLDFLFGPKIEVPTEPRLAEREWTPPPAYRVTDLDKAWHSIHFMLTGEVDGGPAPNSSLMSGGTTLGKEEVGYDLPRLLSPFEVASFSDFLSGLDEAAMRERFDPPAFAAADVYPSIWDEEEDEFPYIWGYFEQLQQFMREAAAAGDAVVVTIT